MKDKVISLIAETLDIDKKKINEKTNLVKDLEVESLDLVDLVGAFEEEFGCEIPDEAAEKILTVKDAIDYLSKAA